ncbi:putative reverse transcriptase zinc-binding domain-containing protein [Helianthus debilis subsp. tardiflorus]
MISYMFMTSRLHNRRRRWFGIVTGRTGGLVHWNLRCSRHTVLEGVQSEVDLLKVLLNNTALHAGTDMWGWLQRGVVVDFSVKAVRSVLAGGSKVSTGQFEYVWSKSAVLKVKRFVWRVVSGKIPTTMALMAKGVAFGDGFYPMCGVREETVDHLLVECA